MCGGGEGLDSRFIRVQNNTKKGENTQNHGAEEEGRQAGRQAGRTGGEQIACMQATYYTFQYQMVAYRYKWSAATRPAIIPS